MSLEFLQFIDKVNDQIIKYHDLGRSSSSSWVCNEPIDCNLLSSFDFDTHSSNIVLPSAKRLSMNSVRNFSISESE